ncbi:MAG: YlxR family protein [Solirubrobacteraceae bacterium]|nr:YlxR family protein [Solirubrobacteraceae bacterium]
MTAPERRCIGCGERAPKRALRRLAIVDDHVVVDEDQRLPGRGAYVHDDACMTAALTRRALPRAFRRQVHIDDTPGPELAP